VIVANPRSDESPRGFPSGRVTKSGHLVGFTAKSRARPEILGSKSDSVRSEILLN